MKSTLNSTVGKPIRIPAVAKVAARLEAMMNAARPFADADDAKDVQLALASLLVTCHDVLDFLASIGGRATTQDVADAACAARMDALRDRLASSLPSISGGAPDDFEDLDPEFEADPASWPAWTDADRWEPSDEDPTPLEVLALSAPTWEPSEQDWHDYADWCDGRLSEADHVAACGHA